MKSLFLLISILIVSLAMSQVQPIQAQVNSDPDQVYLIIKNDGSRYVGKVLSQDAREVTLLTDNLGEIIIPKHEIKEIRPIEEGELTEDGRVKETGAFATRYYLSTNARAITKGDNYIVWNLYGPDIQFGVNDKFGVGLVTTWFGSPIIGTAKYSLVNKDKFGIAVGTLLGTGSWASPQYGIAVPFGSLTFGSQEKNVSLSLGYGGAWGDGESGGAALLSLAAMNRVNERVSLVFDSFIVGPENNSSAAIFIPALRLHSSPKKAFQIGFAGIAADGELLPIPFPFLQWFRKF